GRPPRAPLRAALSPASATRRSSRRSATSEDTVARESPVRRAISARLALPSRCRTSITRRRLLLRSVRNAPRGESSPVIPPATISPEEDFVKSSRNTWRELQAVMSNLGQNQPGTLRPGERAPVAGRARPCTADDLAGDRL